MRRDPHRAAARSGGGPLPPAAPRRADRRRGVGLFPNLGFGFPPAMVTVASAGTAVALLLRWSLARNVETVRNGARGLWRIGETSLSRILVAAAPGLLAAYIFIAGGFWVAHWLEQGQHVLYGLGTLLLFLVMPIADRFRREVISAAIRGDSESAERVSGVFSRAWRVLVGLLVAVEALLLWGLVVIEFAKGPRAPAWADTGFDIVVTLLIGAFIWRLIGAALHYEKRVSDASEDVDPSEIPSASRLDTLTPLFRNVLFAFLSAVILMIVPVAGGRYRPADRLGRDHRHRARLWRAGAGARAGGRVLPDRRRLSGRRIYRAGERDAG